MSVNLGRVGVWTFAFDGQPVAKVREAAAELDELGFGDDDLIEGGSDRLVEALVAWGDAGGIAKRVREHLDAGADHVCVQVLSPEGGLPARQWRELAPALLEL
ncbi:hypothetical protein AB0395_02365 [Streptosporangium sp. NPDC051023]|uniref:hypothetical protein n=1 Tax=Streptosporangium sp. NPDC051023 TaxID=3155410 RepID=UPI00344F9028